MNLAFSVNLPIGDCLLTLRVQVLVLLFDRNEQPSVSRTAENFNILKIKIIFFTGI